MESAAQEQAARKKYDCLVRAQVEKKRSLLFTTEGISEASFIYRRMTAMSDGAAGSPGISPRKVLSALHWRDKPWRLLVELRVR